MPEIARQYEYNTSRSKHYKSISDLPAKFPEDYPVRYIAYYLPQYHAIRENNEWWGPGFTEWTNVTKALPRYLGHYQPRLPADLGFYDLSNPDHIRCQVALAKRGGVYGFCIHNYWFSGRRVLETPLRLIVENKDIDIPFCVNWANENWSRRWDGSEAQILLRQRYAVGEDVKYAEYISEFASDKRYIKIDGRPLIMLYRPGQLPDARASIDRWRQAFVKAGLSNPYIVMPQAHGDDDPRVFGLDAAAGFPPHEVGAPPRNIRRWLQLLDQTFVGKVFSYEEIMSRAIANVPNGFRLFPGVCPDWDNEARRPNRGTSLAGSTPQEYGNWLKAASETALKAPTKDERIVFINAWNEWAEGAYLEPDRHYGCSYLLETLKALDSVSLSSSRTHRSANGQRVKSRYESAHSSPLNYLRNLPRLIARSVFRNTVQRFLGWSKPEQ
jgi:glycosyl transferase family WbsX